MFEKIAPEDVVKAFQKEEPDSKRCLHDFRAHPIGTLTADGDLKLGLIARSVQHDADGNITTHDFIITPDVMERIAEELHSSASVLGLVNAMRGMPGVSNTDLLSLLESLNGLDVTQVIRDASTTSVPEPRETT